MEQEILEETLNTFLRQEVTISINGIISLTVIYQDFRYLLNNNRLLLSDSYTNEIDIEIALVEKMIANDKRVYLKLDNDEEMTIEV